MSTIQKFLLTLLIYCVISVGGAAEPVKPLPASEAFTLTAFMDNSKQLILQWALAPDYYLYQQQIKILPTNKNKAKIGTIVLPDGEIRHDDLHGTFQAYTNNLVVHVPIEQTATGLLNLSISYQGCSSKGFCYPPVRQNISVNMAHISGPTDLTDNLVNLGSHPVKATLSKQGYITQLLMGHHWLVIIMSFLVLGLLLAFTPCVLPMVPILSSIIIGFGNKISTHKAFMLSLAYVLGMAVTYAAAGMLVAMAGSSVQVALQKPWVIIVFSFMFAVLALSLFGLFELRLPNKLQQRVTRWSHRHEGGTYLGVFFMGGFSTLVVSPCVSAPLVGVLAYIAESGDIILGGVALLALGIGMGIPLLLIGTSAGKLLPKSGAWMNTIKHLFGLLMLALAIWMLSRVFSADVIIFLWALLAIGAAVFIWQSKHSHLVWRKLHQGFGLALLSYGFILVGGAFSGSTDPLHPLSQFGVQTAQLPTMKFAVVKDMNDLNQQLSLAKAANKQVLLDFYANWCVSCVAMDTHVFNRPEIFQALNNFVILRADVTENNEFDQELQRRFNVIAPPTIIFFNAAGKQLQQQEIVGEVDEKEFLTNITKQDDGEKTHFCESGIRAC
jgi:thiol:disulfide interchange protein DsbD